MNKFNQVKAVVVGLVLSSAVIPAAMADDIEIYTTDPAETAGVNPNILFLVDNSISMGSMNPMYVTEHYDPDATYSGDCAADGIYFVPLGQKGPDCSTTPAPGNYFNRSALECDVAKNVYAVDPADGVFKKENPATDASLNLFGTYSDQFARYNDLVNNAKKWEKLPAGITATAERDYEVECLSDSGLHGGPGGKDYIQDGNGYTSTVPANLKVPHPVWGNGEGHITIWDGNYLNYLAQIEDGTIVENGVETTRIAEMVRAVDIMVSTNSRINISLISLDENSAREGGSIQYPMQDIGLARSNFKKQVLPGISPDAYTTLSETYYEALLYFGGKKMDYGVNAAGATPGSAKDGGGAGSDYYKTPISSTCAANYIVVLSDGTPTKDDANTENAAGVDRFDLLPGMSKTICNTEHTSAWNDDNQDADDPGNSVVDNCLPELAEWANTHDVATQAITAHAGDQTIVTHSIAFALDPADTGDAPAINLLKDTATGEGSQFFIAQTGDELVSIFQAVITKALKVNTTFSSPAVSVNAFNRSTHLDDLYFTLFKPHATNNAWAGNLKKYKIKFATDAVTKKVTPFIADSTNSPAVDADTGFFGSWARSFWSAADDGKLVGEGGAASRMPDPRKVYTITGGITDDDSNGVFVTAVSDLTNAVNEVLLTNDELTDTLLGIDGWASLLNDAAGDPIPYRDTLINWAAGEDVFSRYGDLDTTGDARLNMGDPLHAEPALVQYGKDVDDKPILTAFVATNDGYLHAFDADTGIEKFSFIPQELLTALPGVMENNQTEKTYGLDGSVVAWIKDDAKDGIDTGATGTDPAAGDHVYLYFGMRRGGRNIYALNVTDPDSPALMWVIKGGQGDYANLGETWSTVNVREIKDGATEKTVLIFGGGYDATQDNALVRTVDGVGNTVYIADAATGAKLWSASHADMDYSIPARVIPVDVSVDGFIDRLYAADMGGQVFRFDINNNSGALSASITGGRVADLAGDDEANARRFYYPPDVALIDAPDGAYHALVLSSGFRAHPLNKTIHDRIYMIKDRNTGLLTSNDAYRYDPAVTDAAGSLTEDNLYNATVNLAGGEGISGTDESVKEAALTSIGSASGWYINLSDEDNSDAWIGEKGLAEPLIIEGKAVITTYLPPLPLAAGSCGASEGTGKVFFVEVEDGTAAYPSSADARSERHKVLARDGIPPSPNVIITSDGEPTLCLGTECESANFGLGIRKTYWYEVN